MQKNENCENDGTVGRIVLCVKCIFGQPLTYSNCNLLDNFVIELSFDYFRKFTLYRIMSKIPDVDSKRNARKREFTAPEISTSLGDTEHHGKQCKLEESLQEGHTMQLFEINSKDPNEEEKFMKFIIEKIISNLPLNKATKVATFNPDKPILLTIPIMVKRVGKGRQERFFW